MIAEIAPHVPPALAAYRDAVALAPAGTGGLPPSLREPDAFASALSAFGAGYGPVDPRVLVSYWSQHYFALLATPALTALLRLGQPLPLAFDATRLEHDAHGRPVRLLVVPDARGPVAPGLAGLVESHLRPFVALCHRHCGIAPRVLWGNAAVILDYAARQFDDGRACAPACTSAARAEVAACLGWCGGAACRMSPLAHALCPGAQGCRRRACCLRHRLPGVPSCGALCPLEPAQDS